MTFTNKFVSIPQVPSRDGDDAGAGGDDAGAGADAAAQASAQAAATQAAADAAAVAQAEATAAAAKAAADAANVVANQGTDEFTPEQQLKVNALLAKQKTKMQDQPTQARLQSLSETTALNDEERASLLAAQQELEKQLKTRAQIEADEKAKIKTEYEEQLAQAQAEVVALKQTRDQNIIDSALMKAFEDGEAYNPRLSMVHLKPYTKLSEDGKKALVHFPNDKSTSADDEYLVFTPAEAVKHMKTIPAEFGNLFKSNVASGIGGGATGVGFNSNPNQVDIASMSYKEYLAHTRGEKN